VRQTYRTLTLRKTECEVSVPVSQTGFGTYATLWGLLGLPSGWASAPNSFDLSCRALWVLTRAPSIVIWTTSPTRRTPATLPLYPFPTR
jgi:hypothetical protein